MCDAPLDHTAYPQIIERVIALAPHELLLGFRSVSRATSAFSAAWSERVKQAMLPPDMESEDAPECKGAGD